MPALLTLSRTTLACAAVISLLDSGAIHAATETWDGDNTPNPFWFANTNWLDNTAPVDGSDLIFTGTVLLNHSAYGNWGGDGDAQINSITFDAAAGAFVIGDAGGGTYKMLGDITNNSTNLQTLNFPIQLNADVALNAASGDIRIGGVISEDGSARSLIKSGSNIVSLTGANSYTGLTDINVGRLQLGDGGTTGSLSVSSAIDIASGAAFMVKRTDTVTQGTDFSSAAITGAGYIANDGHGTLILDRANSHTGGARLGRDHLGDESVTRVLQVTHNDALGTGTLGFYKSGTFELGADALSIANNVFSGNYSGEGNAKIIKLDLAGTNSGTMSGNIDNRGGIFEGFQMDVGADDTLTLSGDIFTAAGGGSGITKIGDGTLILSGTNTYIGDTRVNAGTLKLSGGSAIGDTRDVVVNASATLDLNGTTETINRLTGSGTINNSTGNGTLVVGSNSSFQFDGTLTDTVGALFLRKTGEGTLTLTAASTHSGGISIAGVDSTANTLKVQHNNALGTGRFLFETGGILELGVSGLTIGNRIEMPNWSAGTRTLKLDLDGANTGEFSGNMWHQNTTFGTVQFNVGTDDVMTYSGNMEAGSASGAGIEKVGNGTLVLSGANTYKGKTGVYGGTLSLASGYTHTQTGLYEVKDGGTLKIADGVNISGHAINIGLNGVLSPGNSPGTAITGSQTWNDGGTYLWEINNSGGTKGADPGWDWLNITGTLELGSLTAGGFTIDIDSLTAGNVLGDAVGFDTFTQSDGIVDYSFVIATASGGINNFDASLFTLDLSDFSNAPSWYWEIVLSGNDLVLEAYAVPEPSSTFLLGLGGLALALRRKRS